MMNFVVMTAVAIQTLRGWKMQLSKNWVTKELSDVRRVLLKLRHRRTSRLTVDAGGDIDFYLYCIMYFDYFIVVVLLWRFGPCPPRVFVSSFRSIYW